jgi:hypothetical protein
MVGGCSSNTPATANAYIDSTVFASADLGAQVCGVTGGPWIEVGTASSPTDDGASQSGFTVSVSCSVTANPDGSFQVNALATVGNSGSVGVQGKFTTSGTQTGIHGSFTRGGGDEADFTSSDCSVSYTMDPNMGVAAGRVWGYITCPDVVDPGSSEIGPDGGAVSRTCQAAATFKFQNCAQ